VNCLSSYITLLCGIDATEARKGVFVKYIHTVPCSRVQSLSTICTTD
jgi:hypothetical protein